MRIKFKSIVIGIIAVLFLAGCTKEGIPEVSGSISYQKEKNNVVIETIILHYNKTVIEKVEIISNLYYSEMGISSESEAYVAFNKYMEDVQLLDGIKLELLNTKADYLVQKMELDFSQLDKSVVQNIFDNNYFIYKDENVSYIETVKDLKHNGYTKIKSDWYLWKSKNVI